MPRPKSQSTNQPNKPTASDLTSARFERLPVLMRMSDTLHSLSRTADEDAAHCITAFSPPSDSMDSPEPMSSPCSTLFRIYSLKPKFLKTRSK